MRFSPTPKHKVLMAQYDQIIDTATEEAPPTETEEPENE